MQSYEIKPILGPKWPICPRWFFFRKTIKQNLIYILAPFIMQNFKTNP